MNNDSNNDISWDEYDKTTYYALCKTWERIIGSNLFFLFR